MPPSDPVPAPEGGFKERHFLEVLRKSGELPEDRIQYALKFQQKALERKGKKIRIERVLVRLGDLDETRLATLYERLRYGIARKEDKWYCRIAVKSKFLELAQTKKALAQQKRLYNDGRGGEIKRVNMLLAERSLMDAEKDALIVEAMRKQKWRTTLRTLLEEGVVKPSDDASYNPRLSDDWSDVKFEPESSELEDIEDSSKPAWWSERHMGEKSDTFEDRRYKPKGFADLDSKEDLELRPASDDLV